MRYGRQPGYENLVDRWTREQHTAGLEDSTHRYLVAVAEDGRISGYLVLQGVSPSPDSLLIKRIAVMRPGDGVGRALILRALSVVFRELAAAKVTLTVRPHNERAVNLCRSVGLTNDGMEEVLRNGEPAFNTVMSMTAVTYWNRQAIKGKIL